MVKRYFCDICDKSFPYSVEGRKKHYNGFQHQQAKSAHYNQFKSARMWLEEDSVREKCRAFHSGQECWFGDNCKYSHLTIADLASLKQQAQEEEEREKIAKLPSQIKSKQEPTMESWLAAQNKEAALSHQPTTEDLLILWQMTSETATSLHSIVPFLPPSLVSPQPSSEWLTSECQDWG